MATEVVASVTVCAPRVVVVPFVVRALARFSVGVANLAAAKRRQLAAERVAAAQQQTSSFMPLTPQTVISQQLLTPRTPDFRRVFPTLSE